jgi:SpoVK/Ycf46/Vps4 family AAA+-type ATPase
MSWRRRSRRAEGATRRTADCRAAQLPPELLRKGRFDEIFFVDLPQADEREEILRIHLRLRRQHPQAFDLPALVDASDGFSDAEIEQAVVASLLGSLQAKAPLTT